MAANYSRPSAVAGGCVSTRWSALIYSIRTARYTRNNSDNCVHEGAKQRIVTRGEGDGAKDGRMCRVLRLVHWKMIMVGWSRDRYECVVQNGERSFIGGEKAIVQTRWIHNLDVIKLGENRESAAR